MLCFYHHPSYFTYFTSLKLCNFCVISYTSRGARWCSGESSHLQPLRPPVRILGRALHVGKLVYSVVCTGFLHL